MFINEQFYESFNTIFMGNIKKKKMCTVHQLRHERVPMWLDLNLTHGMAVSNGKGSVGCKVLSLARAKGVTALGRK